MPSTDTAAYYERSLIKDVKSFFIILDPGANVIKISLYIMKGPNKLE
jgi:hypothetical protein